MSISARAQYPSKWGQAAERAARNYTAGLTDDEEIAVARQSYVEGHTTLEEYVGRVDEVFARKGAASS